MTAASSSAVEDDLDGQGQVGEPLPVRDDEAVSQSGDGSLGPARATVLGDVLVDVPGQVVDPINVPPVPVLGEIFGVHVVLRPGGPDDGSVGEVLEGDVAAQMLQADRLVCRPGAEAGIRRDDDEVLQHFPDGFYQRRGSAVRHFDFFRQVTQISLDYLDLVGQDFFVDPYGGGDGFLDVL